MCWPVDGVDRCSLRRAGWLIRVGAAAGAGGGVAVAAASVVGRWLRVRGAWSVRLGDAVREEASAVVGCTSSKSSFPET